MTQPDRHVVVLSFFATWCKPCMKELPHLQNLYEKYEGTENQILYDRHYWKKEDNPTVRGLEDLPKAGPFLADKGITMPILNDSRGVAKNDTELKPSEALCGRQISNHSPGKKGFDEGEDFEGELIAVIDELLKEQ